MVVLVGPEHLLPYILQRLVDMFDVDMVQVVDKQLVVGT